MPEHPERPEQGRQVKVTPTSSYLLEVRLRYKVRIAASYGSYTHASCKRAQTCGLVPSGIEITRTSFIHTVLGVPAFQGFHTLFNGWLSRGKYR